MHRGYIKLWRKIKDWGWYKCSYTKDVFIHLLLEANHKPFVFMGHQIDSGEVVVGRKKLSFELGLSERSVRTALKHLKSTNDVTIKTTSHFSIVSIANYKDYQFEATNKTTNKVTSKRPASDQQVTTIKECKNDKNEKNKGNPFFWEFKKLYPNCLAFKRTKGVFDKLNPDEVLWGVMRKAILEHKESKSWKQGYVPASFKWLEEERWKDVLGAKKVECPF